MDTWGGGYGDWVVQSARDDPEHSRWRLHFTELLQAFPMLLRKARQLESPNEGDEKYVKLAFVGFQHAAPASGWTRSHQQVIRDLRNGDYADEELSWYEDDATAVAHELMVGQALLPGFIAGDLEQVVAGASMAEGDA